MQDKERSDSMMEACDAAQLNGLLRRAIGLMKGLEIECTTTSFRFSVISVMPLLKITERYVWLHDCAVEPLKGCRTASVRTGTQHQTAHWTRLDDE